MEDIRQYLLSVIAAAIIAGLSIAIIGNKGTLAAIVKLLAGLFVALSVVSPWIKLRFDDLSSYFSEIDVTAEMITADAEQMAISAQAAIIKDRIEAYILDKAGAMEMAVSIDVKLTESSPPTPCFVTIEGSASPYAKQRLKQIISDELGIPEEQQSWK